jgi:hypothetical protein
MSKFEEARQIRLEWFASVHDSETHPHCHVVIKAVYMNQDGREMRLRFNKEDLKELRQIAGRRLSYIRYQHRAPERAARAMAIQRARDLEQRLFAMQSGLDWIREQIRKHRRERDREDAEHERWLRDE